MSDLNIQETGNACRAPVQSRILRTGYTGGSHSAVRLLLAGWRGVSRLFALALISSLAACAAASVGKPDLALLYNRSASHHDASRNPIIAIPGLMGSKLTDTQSGKIVWGGFDGLSANPKKPEELRVLALPIGDGSEPLSALKDTVRPSGGLDRARVRVLGVPVGLEVYAGIMATLGVGGYRDQTLGTSGVIDYGSDHFTCFQFSYDWRRDIIDSARELKKFILEKRAFVRAEYKKQFGTDKPNIKFDIATHSMGGMVTRYFLMYGGQDLPKDGSLPKLTWEGAKYVERVIFVGTPNGGSVISFENLVNGKKLGPTIPFFPAGLLGTYPSIYQLMPRARHGAYIWDAKSSKPIRNIMDPKLWERNQWGLASPDQVEILAQLMPDVKSASERRRRALALQARILKRTKSFHKAMDRSARPPKGLQMFLVAGDSQKTPQQVSVSSKSGQVAFTKYGDGDETVLRSSALLDEREGGKWQPKVKSPIGFYSTLFLSEKHVELTKSATFRDNVLYWLLEEPRHNLGPRR